jgi:hypothetical protein
MTLLNSLACPEIIIIAHDSTSNERRDCLNMESKDYVEWVPMGLVVKGLVVMVFGIVTVITGSTLFLAGLSQDTFLVIIISWGTLTVIGLVIWNYRGLRITIGGGRLKVNFGFFDKQSFLLEELISCKKSRANFGRYFGIGIRYGLDGSIAYSTSFGDAVEVVPKIGRVFVFSSNNPDQVCQTIENLQTNKAATIRKASERN